MTLRLLPHYDTRIRLKTRNKIKHDSLVTVYQMLKYFTTKTSLDFEGQSPHQIVSALIEYKEICFGWMEFNVRLIVTMEFWVKWLCSFCRSQAFWWLVPTSVYLTRNSSLLWLIHSNIWETKVTCEPCTDTGWHQQWTEGEWILDSINSSKVGCSFLSGLHWRNCKTVNFLINAIQLNFITLIPHLVGIKCFNVRVLQEHLSWPATTPLLSYSCEGHPFVVFNLYLRSFST